MLHLKSGSTFFVSKPQTPAQRALRTSHRGKQRFDSIPERLASLNRPKNRKHKPYAMVGVCGFIGVGKSTLLEDAAKAEIVTFVEYVPGLMLGDYNDETVSQQLMNAYLFQVAMMHGAITRQQNALNVAQSIADKDITIPPLIHDKAGYLRRDLHTNRVVLLERPPLENRIFALANRMMNKMDHQEYGSYLRYVNEEIDTARVSKIPQLFAFLWTTAELAYQNMIERGNESESKYDPQSYLACLHHCYFLDFVLGHIEGFSRNVSIMDWRQWGTYDDVKASLIHDIQGGLSVRALDADLKVPPLWKVGMRPIGEQVPAVTELVQSSDVDDSEKTIPVVGMDLQTGFLFLDLGAYLRSDGQGRTEVQNAVMSHLARLPAKASKHRTRVCHTLVVHNIPENTGLYHVDSVYLADNTYQGC